MEQFFFNKSLQNTHSKLEKSILNHLQKLDSISNDIKKLEEVLSKAALSIDYEYLFDESSPTEEQYIDQYYHSYSVLLQTSHLIVWRRDRNRLLYETYISQFPINDVNLSKPISQPKIGISKPLIECRAHIRLKIEAELDFFYQGIDAFLGQGFLEEAVRVPSPLLIKKKSIPIKDELPF